MIGTWSPNSHLILAKDAKRVSAIIVASDKLVKLLFVVFEDCSVCGEGFEELFVIPSIKCGLLWREEIRAVPGGSNRLARAFDRTP